ncbi:MAG: AMP-binding protein [Gammaproteobacteria bacterium]
MKINIGEFLTRRSKVTPTREGLVCEDVRRTYKELNDRANRLANAMTSLGIGHGDRVSILAFNEPEYYDMYFGLGKIGATLVPINYRLAGPEIKYILSDCASKALVFGPEYTQVVDSIRRDIPAKDFIVISEDSPEWAGSYAVMIGDAFDREPQIVGGGDDTLTILYTSGTTGRPKGAELTHAYYYWNSVNLMSTLGLDVGNTNLIALPLFHIGALAAPPYIVHSGGKAVLLRTLDPKRFLELIAEEKVAGFGSVPQLLDFLKLVPDFAKYDWSSVRTILVYAAPVPVTLIKEYEAAGIEVRQLYGLTECKRVSYLEPELVDSKPTSVGKAIPGTETFLLDAEGKPVSAGEHGILYVRGPHVMLGYWNQPERSAHMLKPGRLPHERVLCTHDWFYTDDEGFLYFVGRSDDIIKTRGEKVSPVEVENVLHAIDGVVEAAVIGWPDELLGEKICAFVTLAADCTLSNKHLRKLCLSQLENFMAPQEVIILTELPKTATGKISKKLLKEHYASL